MCGIAGFLTGKPCEDHHKILMKILRASQERGSDATGIAYFDPGKKKYWIEKHHIDAVEFCKKTLSRRKTVLSKTPICLGHTRRPTVGDPGDNNNNHPIYSKDYIMIHNGTCRLTPEIEDYDYKGEVDSERMLAHIQEKNIKEGLGECSGDAAIALINRRPKKKEILLYRHGNPIYLAHKPGDKTVFFASTEAILKVGLRERIMGFFSKCDYLIRELPENQLWRLRLDDEGHPKLEFVEDIKYGANFSYYETSKGKKKIYSYKDGKTTVYTNEKPSHSTETPSTGQEDIPFHWPKFFNADTNNLESIPDSEWEYCSTAKVLYHKHRRLVRAYDFSKGRAVVCTPETATKRGWAEGVPTVYLPAYQTAKEKIKGGVNSQHTCMRCLAPAADAEACTRCKSYSEWRGLIG